MVVKEVKGFLVCLLVLLVAADGLLDMQRHTLVSLHSDSGDEAEHGPSHALADEQELVDDLFGHVAEKDHVCQEVLRPVDPPRVLGLHCGSLLLRTLQLHLCLLLDCFGPWG